MQDKVKWIQQQRHFKDLDLRYIQCLSGFAQELALPAGKTIFTVEEAAEHFYLLISGAVALEIYSTQRGLMRLQTLHGGDLLGWSWLYPPYQWHFDARSLEATYALRFDAKGFLQACQADHEMGYHIQHCFGGIMVERLQATRLQVLDLYDAQQGARS